VSLPRSRSVAGCFTVPHDGSCRCIGEEGNYVPLPAQLCLKSASSFDGAIRWEPQRFSSPAASAPSSRQASGPSV
jgi:hypothetical protein